MPPMGDLHARREMGKLAVRLPKALVDELHLAPVDEFSIVAASKNQIVVEKRDRLRSS
jgi:antitoxin component of MazEF toxin-antitoxin module